ncbi:MAG TPA: hypothetical protein VNA16_05110, partial [Abditibacteriaceae bacterium]|nr:hypothetical protein [Abditibacteriaceae bacterium]
LPLGPSLTLRVRIVQLSRNQIPLMEAQPLEAQSSRAPAPQLPPPEFAPLSVRARDVLDILDLALRLYKRYFWVLIGWSATVAVLGTLGRSLLYIFLWPLLSGSAVCCVVAAIRGQRVRFNQCWQFTNPRYWPLVGVTFSALLISVGIFILMGLAAAALFFGGALLLQNASGEIKLGAAIIGGILLLIIVTIVATGLIIWQGMVPIVACMEEDKRDRKALARAYDLLRGHWARMITMLTIIGLAGLVLYAILITTIGSITGALTGFSHLGDLFSGRESPENFMDSILGLYFGFLFIQVLLSTLWNPLHHLILTLFYLDIRVRKEALDLEWTAYASAAQTNAATPPQELSTPLAPAPAYAAPTAVSTFAARPVSAAEPLAAETASFSAPPTTSRDAATAGDGAAPGDEANDAAPQRPANL